MLPYLHCSVIHSDQDMETPKCPLIEDWIKTWCMYTLEHHSALRKDETQPFATTRTDLENTILSEISQKRLRTI